MAVQHHDGELAVAQIAAAMAGQAGPDVAMVQALDQGVEEADEGDFLGSEAPVVHVEAAPPGDGERVDAERVSLEDVRVEHRSEEVVRGGDRMEVAREVQIQVLHRDNLRVAASRRTAESDVEQIEHAGRVVHRTGAEE